MAYDASNAAEPGDRPVTLDNEQEVRDWTTSFGCTEVELRAVIQAVGNRESKVRACFGANAIAG